MPNGACSAAWLRVQHSRDLQLARPWLAARSALGGGREISLGSNHFTTRGEYSATLLGRHACSCARCWHSDGVQANAARTARAWCSLEAGGELLAAKKTALRGGEVVPVRIGGETFGRNEFPSPFVAHFHLANPPVFTFQAPFGFTKQVD